MQPIHKLHDKSAFPFHIDYKDQKSPQHELPDHFHEWNELIFIHRGNGVIFIDQQFYDLGEGDLIIVPPNTIHRVIPEKNNLILSTAIFFSSSFISQATTLDSFTYLNIFNQSKQTKDYKYRLSTKYLLQLENYINQLVEEKASPYEDRENGILLWLHLILLTIHRNIQQKKTHETKPSKHEPNWIKETLAYINEHITDDLTLQNIAEEVSVSEAHLSRVFKQLVGMTVSNYIIIKRVHLAKDLFVNSDMTIATIAKQCGFNSMPYFYRTFKKHTSMTPSEFRKKLSS